MKGKEQPLSVKIHAATYHRLKALLRDDPLSPPLLAVVTVAVDDWIKKNTPAEKPTQQT